MNFYGGKEMAASFRTVRGNTITIAADIPEHKYDFQAAPDTRSVRKMLVHIALGTTFAEAVHSKRLTDLSTLNISELMAKVNAEEAQPRTKAEIIDFLKTEGERFAVLLDGLSDEFLAEEIRMRPGAEPAKRTRFEMLLSAKEHEMHHRGQLMLIERMIGVVPHLTRRRQEQMAATPARSQ